MKALASLFLLASLAGGLAGQADTALAQGPARLDRAKLIRVLYPQVRKCYLIPTTVRNSEDAVVDIVLNPDGSLAQPPRVVSDNADSPIAKAALRALARCAPFKIPAEFAGSYATWKRMRITFTTDDGLPVSGLVPDTLGADDGAQRAVFGLLAHV